MSEREVVRAWKDRRTVRKRARACPCTRRGLTEEHLSREPGGHGHDSSPLRFVCRHTMWR